MHAFGFTGIKDNDWQKISPVLLEYKLTESNPEAITKNISNFYFRGNKMNAVSKQAFGQVSETLMPHIL